MLKYIIYPATSMITFRNRYEARSYVNICINLNNIVTIEVDSNSVIGFGENVWIIVFTSVFDKKYFWFFKTEEERDIAYSFILNIFGQKI